KRSEGVLEQINFYDMDYEIQKIMLEGCNGDQGEIISKTEGVCGDIYIFDHGENTTPRYVCAKMPKNIGDLEGTASRFAKEIKTQLSFGRHQYVHWIFDFGEVVGAPIAFFRYWGSDLKKLINDNSICDIKKLSVMAYACSGLMHCYRNGLTSHQDLKPANIFLRDLRSDFVGLPDLPIYTSALIGDFGLANASIDSNVFEG
ncbi:protein kinase, partial [Psychromonas sp. Urea-02u-13]